MWKIGFAWLCAYGLAASALAQPPAPPRYNVIELSASVQREVANDLMSAQLFVELQDASPASLASQLNRALADGVRIAKEVSAVKVRTGSQHTYPVYGRNQQLQGWRGRAELRLETRDFAAGSALLGRLQSTLQLAGMQFAVSPEARQRIENELITEAIAAFRTRAEIARSAFGAKGYKVQRIALSTGRGVPGPRPMVRAMAAEAAVAPPVEAGESTVTASASGAIEAE